MRAMVAWAVCAALTLTSTSCSHVVRRPLDREVTERMDVEEPWIEMEGWTDANGGKHERKGYARVTSDSVLVYDDVPTREGSRLGPSLSIARSDVAQVHVRRFSWAKTSMAVVLPIATLIGLAAATKPNSIGD